MATPDISDRTASQSLIASIKAVLRRFAQRTADAHTGPKSTLLHLKASKHYTPVSTIIAMFSPVSIPKALCAANMFVAILMAKT